MERTFFLKTERLGFSRWEEEDLPLAERLWGEPRVTRYICADGVFAPKEIRVRLDTEIRNGREYGIQYWPLFLLSSGEFAGCCGLRPREDKVYEMGLHLLPAFWGKGYSDEAARAVMDYAFQTLQAEKLFAGHNPHNEASRGLISRLGFLWIGDEYYAPTGLFHPSYEIRRPK